MASDAYSIHLLMLRNANKFLASVLILAMIYGDLLTSVLHVKTDRMSSYSDSQTRDRCKKRKLNSRNKTMLMFFFSQE